MTDFEYLVELKIFIGSLNNFSKSQFYDFLNEFFLL